MSVGVFVALAVVVAMAVAYSGGIWLLVNPKSPLTRLWHRRSIDREVTRLTADLDRRLAELSAP